MAWPVDTTALEASTTASAKPLATCRGLMDAAASFALSSASSRLSLSGDGGGDGGGPNRLNRGGDGGGFFFASPKISSPNGADAPFFLAAADGRRPPGVERLGRPPRRGGVRAANARASSKARSSTSCTSTALQLGICSGRPGGAEGTFSFARPSSTKGGPLWADAPLIEPRVTWHTPLSLVGACRSALSAASLLRDEIRLHRRCRRAGLGAHAPALCTHSFVFADRSRLSPALHSSSHRHLSSRASRR